VARNLVHEVGVVSRKVTNVMLGMIILWQCFSHFLVVIQRLLPLPAWRQTNTAVISTSSSFACSLSYPNWQWLSQ